MSVGPVAALVALGGMIGFVVTLALLVLAPCAWFGALESWPSFRAKFARCSILVSAGSNGAVAGVCIRRFDFVGFVALSLLAIFAVIMGRLVRGPLRLHFRIAGASWTGGAVMYGLILLWRLCFE
ncbi:MAG: hypothetical protein JNK05_09765 [Myxococcales bacterium]|nr:hypothetical protein [Myxococcales bacterium]